MLFVSVVLLSLLAIGAVSADSNIGNDSFVQQASLDDEQLNVEEVDDIKDESTLTKVGDVLSDEIISGDENKDTPIINVENITVDEYSQPVIPFNVTDSEGNLISGEVIVTIYDSEDNIGKDIFVYNGDGIDSFKKLDLNNLLIFNNGLELLDAYNIVYSSMNSTNFNSSLIGSGFSDISKGINLNVSRLLTDIIALDIINVTKIADVLKTSISQMNVTNLNAVHELSKAVKVNKTAFINALKFTLKGFNLTIDDIIPFFLDIQKSLNLKFSLAIGLELLAILNGPEILNLHDVFKLVKDVYVYNNLNMPTIVKAFLSISEKYGLNSVDVAKMMVGPNSTVGGGLSKLFKSFSIDVDAAADIVKNIIGKYQFDINKVINAVSEITGFNSSKIALFFDGIKDIFKGFFFNETYAVGWLKDLIAGNHSGIANKILNISQLNTSSIKMGFDKIIPAINFKLTTFLGVCSLIGNYGKFNSSVILGGLDKIVMGLGANVSTVLSKAFSKIGYYASFPSQKPGIYKIIIRYLENDNFTYAAQSANLNITPFENYTINMYVSQAEAYGDDTILYIFLMDGFGNDISGVVNVFLNGINIANVTTDEYGYAECVVKNLSSGKYLFECEHDGVKTEADVTIFVPIVETGITCSNVKTKTVDVVVDGKTGKYFKGVLKDVLGNVLANKEILISYNGKTYMKTTDKNGAFKFQLNIKKAGSYSISAYYLGDNIYKASYAAAKITVTKQTPKITAKKATYKVKTKKKLIKATFKSAKNHPVKGKLIKFTVKGKTYSAKTNKKGIASVNIKLAKKGTYKVAVKFAGDTTYNKVTKKITLKIK